MTLEELGERLRAKLADAERELEQCYDLENRTGRPHGDTSRWAGRVGALEEVLELYRSHTSHMDMQVALAEQRGRERQSLDGWREALGLSAPSFKNLLDGD